MKINHIGGAMELRNIATFLKVAGTQNFSKAAEQLGYSQSAVTVQIQQLEKELNTQLFERIGKRVYLTEKGQEFVDYADQIMKVVDQALGFSGEKNHVQGKLRIGGVESVCTALLPELILQLHQMYPDVDVVIQSGTTTELIEMARTNGLDLVFTFDKKLFSPEWVCAWQKTEEVIFVTTKEWGLENIEIKDLVAKPFILTERGAAYQYELEQLLAERELRIEPVLEIGNTETIIKLVKKGMGMSFLPEFTVKKEMKRGRLLRLSTDVPEIRMYCQLLYHKNKHITPQMKAFMELVHERLE